RPRLARKPYLVGAGIDLEPAEPQHLISARARSAPQDRLHPRQQLARLEWLGQIVVGAELEPDDAIHGIAARGEHQDRRLRLHPDAAAHIKTIDVGQREVENDAIEALARVARDAELALGRNHDVKARLAEIALHHLGKTRVIFDEQDAAGHKAILTPPPAAPEARPRAHAVFDLS